MSADRCLRFRALHDEGPLLLLPNGWDHASVAVLARAGFEAVATTSLGVAAAAGSVDGEGLIRAETVDLVRRTSGLCLVSADVEGGFGDAGGVARELAEAGAVGLNLEDGMADGSLAPAERHAEAIASAKQQAPDLFVNARTDVFWLQVGDLDEAVRRLRSYADAGADGVFVPGAPDEAAIRRLVEAVALPLNVLYQPTGPSLGRLAELGVRRVSLGSLLFRVGLGAALRTAERLRAGRPDAVPDGTPAYADVQAIAGS
jgi:2-methylisocitrate lyase-like PEP mutase family enzyme